MLSRRHIRRCIFLSLGCTFLSGMLAGIYLITAEHNGSDINLEKQPVWLNTEINRDQKWFGLGGSQLLQKIRPIPIDNNSRIDRNTNNQHMNINIQKQKSPERHNDSVNSLINNTAGINYNVHIFYYMWYGNPEVDGKYFHWDHKRMPHWDKVEAQRWPTHSHEPPGDIGANFYPELGAYSSQDPHVMENHMQQIQTSGAGVLVVSWYPPSLSDDNGTPWDQHIPKLMDIAHKYHLKICFHMEPFKDRTAASVRHWIQYIIKTYGGHPAFYRYHSDGKYLPLFYLYDSYQVGVSEWAQLFTRDGDLTVRGTELDGIFIALLVESKHKLDIRRSGFDGFYTYFASTGFSYGSSTTSWKMLAHDAKKSGSMFIPSVGPGYIDDRVRPWNKRNTKPRDGGKYYEHMFRLAVECDPPIVSITSFNEWHEGTQIESAVPKTYKDFKYLDYQPNGSNFYLELTRKWVKQFTENKR